jgi:hypothetical protein
MQPPIRTGSGPDRLEAITSPGHALSAISQSLAMKVNAASFTFLLLRGWIK